MKYSLLKGLVNDEIAKILQQLLDLDLNRISSIYQEIIDAKENSDWSRNLESDLLKGKLIEYKNSHGLGIDFPIWFDWETDKTKIMVIGRDPQRNHNDNKLIISTPFGLASKGGRETTRNKYWQFIEPLLVNNRIYITDVFKLFIKTDTDSKKLKKEIKFHYDILKEEYELIKPDKIITIGKDAKIAISNILGCSSAEPYVKLDNLEMFFVPHISNMVLQNLVPIANLFISIGKLKNNNDLEKIGYDILQNGESLFK